MGRSLGHLGEINADDWRNQPDFLLGPWWVGDFCPELDTKDYGSNEFHGRFHPAIPWTAMKRFTKPGDVVWDCFAGSGTTLDVGDELDREVIASDLFPIHKDIVKADASVWDPGAESVDLAIMHPPYWNMVDYGCTMSSALTIYEYVNEFTRCLHNVSLSLRDGKVLVLVIGEVFVKGELFPLEYYLDRRIMGISRYRRIGRIVKDYGKDTKGGASTGGRTGNLWKYRLLKHGYFRYGIDTVLFYQKRI